METHKRKRCEDDENDGDAAIHDYVTDQPLPHQIQREELERYRIDKLIHLKKERDLNDVRRKELEFLDEFLKEDQSKSETIVTFEKSRDPILEEIIQSQSEENIVKLNVGGQIFVTTNQPS